MSNYSPDKIIFNCEYEENRFTLIPRPDRAAYSIRKETLQHIAEIFGDGWFVRSFTSSDIVEFSYNNIIYRVEHPEYVHILSQGSNKYGILMYKVLTSPSGKSYHSCLINVSTGEALTESGIWTSSEQISCMNISPRVKILGSPIEETCIFSYLSDATTKEENLYVFGECALFNSLGNESKINLQAKREVNATTWDNFYIGLVRMMVCDKNTFLISSGDVMMPVFNYSIGTSPIQITLGGYNYVKYRGARYYRIENDEV